MGNSSTTRKVSHSARPASTPKIIQKIWQPDKQGFLLTLTKKPPHPKNKRHENYTITKPAFYYISPASPNNQGFLLAILLHPYLGLMSPSKNFILLF